MSVEIRRMKLTDFFKLGNLVNDKPDLVKIELVENKNISSASKIYNKTNLFLSLMSPKLALKKFIVFVCVLDGKIEGILHLTLRKKREALLGIFLNKRVRNRGLGTEMMKTAIDWARTNNMTLTLTVGDWNRGAVRVYKKCGFKVKRKFVKYVMALEK